MIGPRPSVGRIVHYVPESCTGDCYAAVVTEVPPTVPIGEDQVVRRSNDGSIVTLFVMPPRGMFVADEVPQDELPPPDRICVGERTTHRPGTWHWPERIP